MEFRTTEVLRSTIFGRQAPVDTSTLVPTAPGDRFPTTSLQQGGFAILFLFPTIALLVVCLRIFSRRKMKQFGWDDGLIVAAMILSIGETAAGYMGMRTAFLGVHPEQIPWDADRGIGMMWNFVGQILYNPILAIVKSSVLLFMLRLGGHRREVRLTIHALNGFNIALAIAIFVAVIFQCTPVPFFWRRMTDPTAVGTCVDTAAFYVITAGLTILTDLLVLGFPFWIFMGLKLPMKVKMALIGVFLLGAVVTVVGILRLAWLVEISYGGVFDQYDIRFVYSAVETNLAIATACGPALRPLLRSWFPRFFSSLDSGYGSNAPYGSKYGVSASTDGKKLRTGTGTNPSKGGKSAYGTSSFVMNDMKRGTTEIRDVSPSGSEEQIMTYNGIVRTTEVDVQYGETKSNTDRSVEEGRRPQQSTRFDY